MSVTFNTTNFNNTITDGVHNSGIPSETETLKGVVYNSYSDAVIINKFMYNLSAALEYLQSNGTLLWQKGKDYKLGSVVNVIEKRNNFYTLRKLRCIKVDSGDVTQQQPLSGSLNIIPDSLATYYTGVNGVNTNYWVEIFDKDDKIIDIQLTEGKKSLKLFEIPMTGYFTSNFDVNITRYNSNTRKNDYLRFTVEFECNNYDGNRDNIIVSVYNVNCNNYNRTSITPSVDKGGNIKLEDNEYIFGKSKFSLLGFTLSTMNNSLNLDIFSDAYSYIDPSKSIDIKLYINRSDINFTPVESAYNDKMGEDVIVIREGNDNTGTDCGYIVESTTRYTKEEQFKRGLLMITDDNCILNTSERPGFSKNFSFQFNPDEVVSMINDKSNRDYSSHVLPLIQGETYGWYSSEGWSNWWDGMDGTSTLFGGYILSSNRDRYVETGFNTGTMYPLYVNRLQMTVTSEDKTKNIFNSKQPELNVLSKNPALYPKSVRVYRYFKY